MIDSSLSKGPLRICALASLFLLAGCSLKQDMALQPKNRPLSPSDFFTDGRSARPLVENTVARGSVLEDVMAVPKDSNAFPLPLKKSSARPATACKVTATAWWPCAA